MNRPELYIKTLIALLAVILIMVAAQVFIQPSVDMNRSPEQVLTELKRENHLAPLAESMNTPGDSLHLVDLRPSILYEQGHLQGAVNLPLRSLGQSSEIDRLKIALKSGKRVFLYAEKMNDAEGAWMYLYQMGLDGIRVLRVDVDNNASNLKITEHQEDVELKDYAAKYKELSTKPIVKAKALPQQKKSIEPVKKKKKKAPEGGC